MFYIQSNSKDPIFEQIKEQIKQYIGAGILKPNDKLPSVRDLAKELGINPNTVAKAYMELESEKILVSQYKKGYFVGESDVRKEVKEKNQKQHRALLVQLKVLGVSKEEVLKVVEEVYDGGEEDA